MSEFGFELSLCARLEAGGVPALGGRDAVIAGQLGAGVAAPGGRVLDVLVVEPGSDFADRAAITPEGIPRAAIEADLGPGRSRRVTDAFDVRPDRARSIAEHAAEIGFLELERRSGHLHARQVARYPTDWFGEIVGIENKPDLGRPGALEEQLRTDVSLGVVDRVVLATETYVTGAHRNRIPDEVGIWRFDPADGSIAVLREAESLPVTEPGVEVLDRDPGQSSIEIVAPAAISRARRRIAERAYGKGWRTFTFPPCSEVEARGSAEARSSAEAAGSAEARSTAEAAGSAEARSTTEAAGSAEERSSAEARESTEASLPWCGWKGRIVDPATECGEDCPGFKPGSPPQVDPDADRDAASPWIGEPDGRQRRQAGLDRFE